LDYLNARYYNPSQGQFLPEDPLFWVDLKTQNLADPQSLNAYSYANDNPITKSDPSGKSSLSSWFGDPFGTASYSEYLGIAAGGAQISGGPATAALLSHSLSLNPGPMYAGNGSVLTQAITSNSLYQVKLQAALQAANSKGMTSINNQVIPLNFTQGDAYTAFGKIDLTLNGTKSKNGSWQVLVSGSDVYDFALNSYGGSKFVGSVNNLAYFAQMLGKVSNSRHPKRG
jgi:RHS repeat-associated protein